ncbi:hypothetical protein L1987_15820 [Smallanthus sonchifolius]|uniref:Uncharacterized protein n=1 Tax=Smallanthus sonchifolius TaxID=185202 RepID=A0ACB9J8R1_9ASTR|nr:hypothetical protein L1987_15820 [Smallanthus sonchifolius]
MMIPPLGNGKTEEDLDVSMESEAENMEDKKVGKDPMIMMNIRVGTSKDNPPIRQSKNHKSVTGLFGLVGIVLQQIPKGNGKTEEDLDVSMESEAENMEDKKVGLDDCVDLEHFVLLEDNELPVEDCNLIAKFKWIRIESRGLFGLVGIVLQQIPKGNGKTEEDLDVSMESEAENMEDKKVGLFGLVGIVLQQIPKGNGKREEDLDVSMESEAENMEDKKVGKDPMIMMEEALETN